MTCDVCGLPDLHRGQGDGYGSCDCPRCDCGEAKYSVFCDCPPADEWDDDGGEPWPDDVIARPVETIEIPGVSR